MPQVRPCLRCAHAPGGRGLRKQGKITLIKNMVKPGKVRLDNPTENTFTCEWDPVPGATGYKLIVREVGSFHCLPFFLLLMMDGPKLTFYWAGPE